MNTAIEIHDNNTHVTGTYSVWYKDEKNETHRRILSENYVNALLEINQKEKFFMGKYKFKIKSEYDFKTIVLNGEKRPGLILQIRQNLFKMASTILCRDLETYKRYYVKAELIRDFHATPVSEKVAWNGTLQLWKTKTGKYFLERHSGLSGTDAIALEITDYCNNPEELSFQQAKELYIGLI